MEQGSDLARVEKERDTARAKQDQAQAELERLKAELDDLKMSSRSNTESLVTLKAEKGQLEDRLHDEKLKNEELRCDMDT